MDHSCVIVSSYPVLYTSVPLEKLGTWPNQTIMQCSGFVVQKAIADFVDIQSNLSLSGSPLLPTDYQNKRNQIVGYLRNDNSRIHAVYVLRFVICEIMNFLIVVSILSDDASLIKN